MDATLERLTPIEEVRLRHFLMIVRAARGGYLLTHGPTGDIPERIAKLANYAAERGDIILHSDIRGTIRAYSPERWEQCAS